MQQASTLSPADQATAERSAQALIKDLEGVVRQQRRTLEGARVAIAAFRKEAARNKRAAEAQRVGRVRENAEHTTRVSSLRLDLAAEHEVAVAHIRRWEMVARAFTVEMEKRMQFETELEETRASLSHLRQLANNLLATAARPVGYDNTVLLVDAAALRALREGV